VATSDDPGAVLGRIKSIKVPSLREGEAYTVHKVDAVTMLANGSALVRTSTGLNVLMAVGDNVVAGDTALPPAAAAESVSAVPNTPEPVNNAPVKAQGRKLLQAYDFEDFTYQVFVYRGVNRFTTAVVSPISTVASVKAKNFGLYTPPVGKMKLILYKDVGLNHWAAEVPDGALLQGVDGLNVTLFSYTQRNCTSSGVDCRTKPSTDKSPCAIRTVRNAFVKYQFAMIYQGFEL
jgi:hypothetical protein